MSSFNGKAEFHLNLNIISQSWDMSQMSFETNLNLMNTFLTGLNGRILRPGHNFEVNLTYKSQRKSMKKI
jgi:hypothetical protein